MKFIKYYELGAMSDLELFEAEAESELESIEDIPLDWICFYAVHYLGKRNGTPSISILCISMELINVTSSIQKATVDLIFSPTILNCVTKFHQKQFKR